VRRVSRRDQIVLSESERLQLLEEERVAVVSSLGPRGWPHSMPLWFVPRAGEIWIWTYAKSQKVRNLERDPRASLQVETGEKYEQLRGVMFQCETTLHREADDVAALGVEIFERYTGGPLADDVHAMVLKQAAKRVAMEFVEHARVTWDHRKLAGVY
jgi:general stress protein 26